MTIVDDCGRPRKLRKKWFFYLWGNRAYPLFQCTDYCTFLQFLAHCCLLVDFAREYAFLFKFFFPNTFCLETNNNSKMRSWISLPSQFPFLSFVVCIFKKKSISVLATTIHAKNESKQIFAEIFPPQSNSAPYRVSFEKKWTLTTWPRLKTDMMTASSKRPIYYKINTFTTSEQGTHRAHCSRELEKIL